MRCGLTCGLLAIVSAASLGSCSNDVTTVTTSGTGTAETPSQGSPVARQGSPVQSLSCPPGDRVFGFAATVGDQPPASGPAGPQEALDAFLQHLNLPDRPQDRAERSEAQVDSDSVKVVLKEGGQPRLLATAVRSGTVWVISDVQACNSFLFGTGASQ